MKKRGRRGNGVNRRGRREGKGRRERRRPGMNLLGVRGGEAVRGGGGRPPLGVTSPGWWS